MNFIGGIHILYQCSVIFFAIILLIGIADYIFNRRWREEDSEDETNEADNYFERMEHKLDLVLKMHGCDVSDEIIERPSESTYAKILKIDDKLDALIYEPCDDIEEVDKP